MTFSLPIDLTDAEFEAARRRAAASNRSLSDVVAEYLREFGGDGGNAKFDIAEFQRLSDKIAAQRAAAGRSWKFDREEIHDRRDRT